MPKTETPMMAPVHPGEILKEDFLDPLGVSHYRLAQAIGVPPLRITTSRSKRTRSVRRSPKSNRTPPQVERGADHILALATKRTRHETG